MPQITAEHCAQDVLDVAPLIMQAIRADMRAHRRADLSVPQFRMLAFLNRNEGASLSGLAEFIGLTLPSASKMVDTLVTRKLVARKPCPNDRRRIKLALTAQGRAAFASSVVATRAHLAALLSSLSDREQTLVADAMNILRAVFAPAQNAEE